jgi:hypothetical protein
MMGKGQSKCEHRIRPLKLGKFPHQSMMLSLVHLSIFHHYQPRLEFELQFAGGLIILAVLVDVADVLSLMNVLHFRLQQLQQISCYVVLQVLEEVQLLHSPKPT